MWCAPATSLAVRNHHENGICDYGHRVAFIEIERRVLDEIKKRLLTPEAMRAAAAAYHAEPIAPMLAPEFAGAVAERTAIGSWRQGRARSLATRFDRGRSRAAVGMV